ncbi:MAG: molybdopterin biosynthesis protein [Thermoprotei archaeon]|nr:molybdopterin biosynthesis protein [Thermoprotei archaeon]
MSKRVIYHELLTPEEGLAKILEHVDVKPVGVEEIDISEAYGRVLAEDVYSPVDVPPFDRSTVDGYAVRAEDLYGVDELNPGRLEVVGSVKPGRVAEGRVDVGGAMEISTGAPLPAGSNAVVMVEYTKYEGGSIIVYKSVVPGENVVSAGSDIMMGELVLRRCTALREREIGVLAAVGLRRVKVYAKPRVAIISTGDELKPPGSPLEPGMIYDINSYSIAASLKSLGAEPVILGIVGDDPEAMSKLIGDAERGYDLVIVSGGTSAGPTDVVYRILDSLGPPGVVVHGLKVKPGKPTVIAVSKSGKLIIGLPGYPGSALMIFNLIVKPLISRMLCLHTPEPRVKARLAVRVEGARGRRGLHPVSLIDTGAGIIAYPMPAESGAIKSLAYSDGFIAVPETVEYLDEGETVEVTLFSSEYRPADLYIVGSHDVGLDRLIPLTGLNVKVINVGSLEGLKAAARGESDISGLHLVDEETGEYNIPYLVRYNVKGAILVRGYMREQGLIVFKGNPHKVKGLEDILDKKLSMVNRSKGSGTRVLLDLKLKEIAAAKGLTFEEITSSIKGYYYEVRTHTAVAAAIAQGKADAGLGIRLAAHLYNLDFISLGWELYDFLIPKTKLDKEPVKKFLKTLTSEDFKRELSKLPGYKIPANMGEPVWTVF